MIRGPMKHLKQKSLDIVGGDIAQQYSASSVRVEADHKRLFDHHREDKAMEFVCHAQDVWSAMEPRWSAALDELPDELEDLIFDEPLPEPDEEPFADFD